MKNYIILIHKEMPGTRLRIFLMLYVSFKSNLKPKVTSSIIKT